MMTYFVYNFILFGSVLSAYFYEQSKDRNKQIVFLFFSFFIPFLFLALRYDIGQDYHNYVEYFNRIASGVETIKEPGYELLNRLLVYFDMDVQWLFVIFGFITFCLVYKTIPRDGFTMAIFLVITTFYLYGYTAIRQALAMAIMFYASKYVYQKRFIMYFLWFLMAASIHLLASVMLLVIYPLGKIHINRYIMIIISTVLFIVVIKFDIAYFIVEKVVLLFPKYSWYLHSEYMEPANLSAGILGPLIKLSIGLIVFYFKDKIIKKYPDANFMINMYFLYIIGSILRLDVGIFNRMEEAYLLYFIMSIAYFVKTFEKSSRVLAIFFISFFYYLMFIRYITIGTIEIENGLHVRPYQTIFERS